MILALLFVCMVNFSVTNEDEEEEEEDDDNDIDNNNDDVDEINYVIR